MSYTKRKLEDLNLLDDFLMNAVTSNEEVGVPFCRRLLSELLQKNIDSIEVISQKVLPPATPEQRGIRLDVEIRESRDESQGIPKYSIYDVEPYLRDTRMLPKHNRFYQARIDSRHMHSGDDDFNRLPNLYVITITREDPFGKNQMVYTVNNTCQEVPDLEYNDGLIYYYFNTAGTEGGNEATKALLNYLENSNKSNVTNDKIKELDQYVNQVKRLPEVKDTFMRFEDYLYFERIEARREGRAEGRAEGCETLKTTILDLLEDYEPIPDDLKDFIDKENDLSKLRSWLKDAARTTGLEDFKTKIGAETL